MNNGGGCIMLYNFVENISAPEGLVTTVPHHRYLGIPLAFEHNIAFALHIHETYNTSLV